MSTFTQKTENEGQKDDMRNNRPEMEKKVEAKKQGSKEARKQGSKEARKQGSKEARKQNLSIELYCLTQ